MCLMITIISPALKKATSKYHSNIIRHGFVGVLFFSLKILQTHWDYLCRWTHIRRSTERLINVPEPGQLRAAETRSAIDTNWSLQSRGRLWEDITRLRLAISAVWNVMQKNTSLNGTAAGDVRSGGTLKHSGRNCTRAKAEAIVRLQRAAAKMAVRQLIVANRGAIRREHFMCNFHINKSHWEKQMALCCLNAVVVFVQ